MYQVRKQIHLEEILGRVTGKGITTAILDTGIFPHPDFDSRIVSFADFVNNRRYLYDDEGHGTHVAGILAGSGMLSGGKYRGMAPEARLIVGKVLDKNGNGDVETMMRGIEWILDNQQTYGIRILNISVGTGNPGEKIKKLENCLADVWHRGIFVAAAAGNRENSVEAVLPIGAKQRIVTVGCLETRQWTDSDIVAPGMNIVSCDSRIIKSGRVWHSPYTAKSGTSMSTPVVAGAAALYMEKNPYAENEQVREDMLLFADRFLYERHCKAGKLNVKRFLFSRD